MCPISCTKTLLNRPSFHFTPLTHPPHILCHGPTHLCPTTISHLYKPISSHSYPTQCRMSHFTPCLNFSPPPSQPCPSTPLQPNPNHQGDSLLLLYVHILYPEVTCITVKLIEKNPQSHVVFVIVRKINRIYRVILCLFQSQRIQEKYRLTSCLLQSD